MSGSINTGMNNPKHTRWVNNCITASVRFAGAKQPDTGWRPGGDAQLTQLQVQWVWADACASKATKQQPSFSSFDSSLR